jgi:hypothetical protein
MGMYASVRGWLEADHGQREAIEAVIAAARRDLYSGGWAFPERPFNWTLYVFYGGDVKESELPWLREQVESMAALPPVNDDGDMPVGLFVISDERVQPAVRRVARPDRADGNCSPPSPAVLDFKRLRFALLQS